MPIPVNLLTYRSYSSVFCKTCCYSS